MLYQPLEPKYLVNLYDFAQLEMYEIYESLAWNFIICGGMRSNFYTTLVYVILSKMLLLSFTNWINNNYNIPLTSA